MFVPKNFSYFIVSNYLKMQKKLPKVYLDININQQPAGRLTIEVIPAFSYSRTKFQKPLKTLNN